MSNPSIGYIYGLHCVCGCPKDFIRYIGQTVKDLNTRLVGHRSQARFGTSTPVYAWMRKHGVENIRIVLLEETLADEIDRAEIEWISRTSGLLNLSPGGLGGAVRGKKRPEHSELMRGEGHHHAKLTEEVVVSARARYTGQRGELSSMAREYGVSASTLESAIKGVTWRHLPGAHKLARKPRISVDTVRDIRTRGKAQTATEIASDLGMTVSNVCMILSRITWKNVE